MIVETINALLLEDAAIVAIVEDRVFPTFLPDAVDFPAIVVTKVGGAGEYDLQGDVGLENARVQVDCYAIGAEAVIALRTAVRRLLSGFKGGLVSGSPCAIASSFCINDLDLSDTSTERAGPRLKRRMLEFSVWNREL